MSKPKTNSGVTAVTSAFGGQLQAAVSNPVAPVLPTPTPAPAMTAMEAELARLKAENEALRNRPVSTGRIYFKVSEKGALSVYGLGRFPVTLYQEQWQNLLLQSDAIKAFIKANPQLKVKER